MEMTQPSNPIVTDKTKAEEKRLTEIRNQVTLLEGESARLRDLIQAEKYEVNELVKQKAELSEMIPKLQSQRDSVGDEIASLTKDLVSLQEIRNATIKEKEEVHGEIEKMKNQSKDIQQKLDTERATLENEKAELTKREDIVGQQAMALAEKQARLRELIS